MVDARETLAASLGVFFQRFGCGNLRVRIPDQALNDLGAIGDVGVGAAQIIELLEGACIEGHGNNVVQLRSPLIDTYLG